MDRSLVGREGANPGYLWEEVCLSRWNSKRRDPEAAAGLQYSENSGSLEQSEGDQVTAEKKGRRGEADGVAQPVGLYRPL